MRVSHIFPVRLLLVPANVRCWPRCNQPKNNRNMTMPKQPRNIHTYRLKPSPTRFLYVVILTYVRLLFRNTPRTCAVSTSRTSQLIAVHCEVELTAPLALRPLNLLIRMLTYRKGYSSWSIHRQWHRSTDYRWLHIGIPREFPILYRFPKSRVYIWPCVGHYRWNSTEIFRVRKPQSL